MEKPNRGIFRPTCGEPYNDSIGDEYHWWYNRATPAGYYQRYRSISRIVGITSSIPIQTIHYQTIKQDFFSGPPPSGTTTISNDTVVVDLSQYPAPCSGPMPKESALLLTENNSHYEELIFGIDSCDRPYCTKYLDDNFTYYLDTTEGPNFYHGSLSMGNDYDQTTTTYGLGDTRIHSYLWYPTIWSTKTLVYYKRGTEECGIPYSEDELLSIDDIDKQTFLAFPNPVKQGDALNLSGFYQQIELLDLSGKSILIKRNKDLLYTGNLSSGIYLLRLTNQKGASTQKLIITHR